MSVSLNILLLAGAYAVIVTLMVMVLQKDILYSIQDYKIISGNMTTMV